MPVQKVRLNGASGRVIRIAEDSPTVYVTITLAAGQEMPSGDLFATAKSGQDQVSVDVFDITGSDGAVTVQAVVEPSDFSYYGSQTWSFEIGTLEEGSGDNDTAYIMLSGSLIYREAQPLVVASVTVEQGGS